jgi:hypothetical protein
LDFTAPALAIALYFAMPALIENWEIEGSLLHVAWKDLLHFGVPAVATFLLVRWRRRFVPAVAVLLLAPLWVTTQGRIPVYETRTFYGVYRVTESKAGKALWHRFYHGTTKHGIQSDLPGAEYVPTAYYTLGSPIGDIVRVLVAKDQPCQIAVVGLGIGAFAAYGRPDWEVTFYEIDPEVERIARNPEWFTFLERSRSPIEVVLGDARLRLADAVDGSYDLMILDAFSSDAIPVHLVTREAVTLYLDKLAEGGILAFHVSNRHLALERVLSAIAADLDLVAQIRDGGIGHGRREAGAASTWVTLTRTAADLGPIEEDPNWEWMEPDSRMPLWTDDRSNLFSVWK